MMRKFTLLKSLAFFFLLLLDLCASINDEGSGLLVDPCLCSGVECFQEKIISLDVADRSIRRLLQIGGEDRVWHHKNKNSKVKPSASTAGALSPAHLSPHVAVTPSMSPSAAPFLSPSPSFEFSSPVPSPSPSLEPPSPVVVPKFDTDPPISSVLPPANQIPPSASVASEDSSTMSWKIYMPITLGVSFLLALSVAYFLCCRTNRVVSVRPWATGLSGQLQRAFVSGVPSLKRSELEIACEDFSNIIGSLSDCKLYKGTLSSGVEIAVVSTVVSSAKDWSKQSEAQFRKKISVLSKVNHKNFVNLLGFCAEQEPFTRMLVFEYAPNGTLFEHLHVKEAEDLDWGARLRIAMGIVYCLDHMHQLDPPVILQDLDSSSIYLTDDYASKVGDIRFWNETKETNLQSQEDSLPGGENIVYKFGLLMLEILSGRQPFSVENGMPEPWFSCYLNGTMLAKNLTDPTLSSYREEDIEALLEVIRSCINTDPNGRPSMAQVSTKLKNITSMSPDGATPKLSPLWWAEIEVLTS